MKRIAFLFLAAASLVSHAFAQCILPSLMNVYTSCTGINVYVNFTQGNATPPYEFAIDVNGTHYNGSGTDPNVFTYEVPWSGNTTASSIGLAVHDAADCDAFVIWNGQVKYTGTGNDRDPILLAVGSTTRTIR